MFSIKSLKRRLIPALFIFFAFLSMVYLIPTCQGEVEWLELDFGIELLIKEIDVENHTLCADVYVGVTVLTKNASYVLVTVNNIGTDTVNCTQEFELPWSIFGVGKTYEFMGVLKDKYWTLNSYGEAYPFDLHFFHMTEIGITRVINETLYPADARWYSPFISEAKFHPQYEDELSKTWKLDYNPIGHAYYKDIFLIRTEFNPQFLNITPLFMLFFIVIFSPSLSKDNDVKIRIYSSILIFSPMFIFAIQNLIPPRTGLSIPEFLGIALMFSVALMLLVSLRKFENEKTKYNSEVAGLMISMLFSGGMAFMMFNQFFTYLPILVVVCGLLLLFIAGIIYRAYDYELINRKKRLNNNGILYEPEGFGY